jgi:hypothetical protein
MTFSGRPLAVAALATTLAAGLLTLLLPAVVPTGPGFAPALVSGCAAIGSLGTVWVWVLTLLVLLDVLRGRTARDGVPRAVRRVVLAACGLSLAGSLASPAYADPGGPDALAGLPLPDRTTTTTQWIGSLARDRDQGPPRPVAARERPADTAQVRVSPGDSLWQLAEDELGAGAGPEDVERRWREIYAANRDVVGADPDLIRPGQRLALPGTTDSTRRG